MSKEMHSLLLIFVACVCLLCCLHPVDGWRLFRREARTHGLKAMQRASGTVAVGEPKSIEELLASLKAASNKAEAFKTLLPAPTKLTDLEKCDKDYDVSSKLATYDELLTLLKGLLSDIEDEEDRAEAAKVLEATAAAYKDKKFSKEECIALKYEVFNGTFQYDTFQANVAKTKDHFGKKKPKKAYKKGGFFLETEDEVEAGTESTTRVDWDAIFTGPGRGAGYACAVMHFALFPVRSFGPLAYEMTVATSVNTVAVGGTNFPYLKFTLDGVMVSDRLPTSTSKALRKKFGFARADWVWEKDSVGSQAIIEVVTAPLAAGVGPGYAGATDIYNVLNFAHQEILAAKQCNGGYAGNLVTNIRPFTFSNVGYAAGKAHSASQLNELVNNLNALLVGHANFQLTHPIAAYAFPGAPKPKANAGYDYLVLCTGGANADPTPQLNLGIELRHFGTPQFTAEFVRGMDPNWPMQELVGAQLFMDECHDGVVNHFDATLPGPLQGNAELQGLFTMLCYYGYHSVLDTQNWFPSASSSKNFWVFMPKANMPDIVRFFAGPVRTAIYNHFHANINTRVGEFITALQASQIGADPNAQHLVFDPMIGNFAPGSIAGLTNFWTRFEGVMRGVFNDVFRAGRCGTRYNEPGGAAYANGVANFGIRQCRRSPVDKIVPVTSNGGVISIVIEVRPTESPFNQMFIPGNGNFADLPHILQFQNAADLIGLEMETNANLIAYNPNA